MKKILKNKQTKSKKAIQHKEYDKYLEKRLAKQEIKKLENEVEKEIEDIGNLINSQNSLEKNIKILQKTLIKLLKILKNNK